MKLVKRLETKAMKKSVPWMTLKHLKILYYVNDIKTVHHVGSGIVNFLKLLILMKMPQEHK